MFSLKFIGKVLLMIFKDSSNPTESEIREWANDAKSVMPDEDWDIIIASDRKFEELFIELAGDSNCPQKKFFASAVKDIAANCRNPHDVHELCKKLESKATSEELKVVSDFLMKLTQIPTQFWALAFQMDDPMAAEIIGSQTEEKNKQARKQN